MSEGRGFTGCGARGFRMIAVGLLLSACGGGAFAQMSESFEYGVPPPGWTKTNLLGGGGWYQLPIGVMPLPGWGNGTSSVPATANAGTHNAYCSWTTGGGAGEGYHNDQWLISPRLTGLTATSTVSYWLRFAFTNFPDTVYFRVSTNGPAPANFTYVPLTNFFARASYPNQFPPWSNNVVNLGALGIPAGTPIWIAIQEYEWDNTHNAAAVQLDVIDSDLTAPPEARVGPTSLTFTAYYEGTNPAPQTFTLQSVGSSGLDYSSAVAFGAGPTSWLTVGGPASGTLGFQGSQVYTASVSVAGLDLGTYVATNVFAVPGATNSPLRVPITLNVIRRPQTISFSNPGPQYTTNKVGLAGTASSGLPVTFSVFSGPGSIVGATNLSFTGTGTVRVVAWQLGNVYYDVAPCVTQAMAVAKPSAAIAITNLSHVYDGAPHGATVTTVPEGLTVETTYDGSAALPLAIGSYAVTCTVNDVLYGGTATATYTITRMPQTVDFPDPGAQWTTNVVGLAATASSGLPVTFSVAAGPGTIGGGTNLSFAGAGTVSVVAAQAGDADWLPAAATNDLLVSKVAGTLTLGDLEQAYDGTARAASATTEPAGLAVAFTYDGNAWAPTNAGRYAVTGALDDSFYAGTATGVLVVAKADQTVAFPEVPPRRIDAVVALEATASSGLTALEYAVVSGPGALAGADLTFVGAGDVLVAARQAGDDNWNPAPAATNVVKGFAVTPTGGPLAGGNEVLIENGRIGDGTNVASVALCGVPATILAQGTNWVRVRCGPGAAGTGALEIAADGALVVSNAYTYHEAGVLTDVSPASGLYVGGYEVTLGGTNLGDGADVTNVTLCGVAAAVSRQSATQIVVVAGASVPGTGDVRVQSTSCGETTLGHAFTYGAGWITNVAPAAANVGGGIQVAVQGVALGNGADVTNVTLAGVAATIATQTVGEVIAWVEAAAAPMTGAVEVVSTTGGRLTLVDAFAYRELAAPEMQAPTDVRPRELQAHWQPVAAATAYFLEVGRDAAFATHVPGYEFRDVGAATNAAVTNLAAGAACWLRAYAWNDGGSSLASAAVQATTPFADGGDFDGDGSADLATFAPAGALWSFASYRTDDRWTQAYGWADTVPVPADYDGDGRADLAVYHPAAGDWYVQPSAGGAERREHLGSASAAPVPGDYDGDGRADLAVFDRANAGRWSFRCSTAGDYVLSWGWPAVVPAPADYDGDGQADVAVYHPASGSWFMLESSGLPSVAAQVVRWGWAATVPVPADYDGDGRADVAVFHRASATWYVRYSGGGSLVLAFGWPAVVPVPADYDGDGVADLAVYHAASGNWYVRQSSDSATVVKALGGPGQNPVGLYPLIHSWYGLP